MKLPAKIPHLKLVIGLLGLYAAIWMALEGALVRDLLLAAATLAIAMIYFGTRFFGGRTLPVGRAVALSAAAGLAYGVGLVLLTLLLMAIKTGLHAHGPEYAGREIVWVWNQLPVWAGVGALAGLGLGLLAAGRR